jgi:hypothetical protein
MLLVYFFGKTPRRQIASSKAPMVFILDEDKNPIRGKANKSPMLLGINF